MIITIDGPAGAGKSSVARALANRLGFELLDTGAMYRAAAWWCHDQGIELANEEAVSSAVIQLAIDWDDNRISVNGRDVTDDIRTRVVSEGASVIAVYPAVRTWMVERQREIASRGNYICEGRDQGTVAFPDAECKFFITASAEVRGERRWKELVEQTPELKLKDVIEEQKARDKRDSTRKFGRLVKADDAVEVVVDQMTLLQVLDHCEAIVRQRMSDG